MIAVMASPSSAGDRTLHVRGSSQPCHLHAMMAIGSFLDNLDTGALGQQDIQPGSVGIMRSPTM